MSGLYALLAAAAFCTIGYVAHAAELVGRYADVNDLHMYCEVHGEGTPILLIHGGLCTIDRRPTVPYGSVGSSRKSPLNAGQVSKRRNADYA